MAVNPYQWFDELYTDKTRNSYNTGTDLPPHVYEASARSYQGLCGGLNQSILVSGESGAGKTETVKICLKHLASIHDTNESIVQKVIDANPLLEAFGNAQTRRNDNSSRFGKYLQLQFQNDEGDGKPKLMGSTNDVYLLEKSRVVHHDESERTFHIFYQLLSSPDRVKAAFWNKLAGKTTSSFKYVGHSATNSIEGKTDEAHFKTTLKALRSIGVEGEHLKDLMTALCVVMQLGNIEFTGCKDSSQVATVNELSDLSELMGLKAEVLEKALTERTMTTRDESYVVPLNEEFARESCDALAKELYQRTFTWLVDQINKASTIRSDSQCSVIGLLDIFGFESFAMNGFEQLCINYANEKLQQKFTNDIFQTVQSEYKFEGLDLQDISYEDNTTVVDLIESPMGLLDILNEECLRPQGSDREFVYKAISENRSSTAMIVKNNMGAFEFGVKHYCASVTYNAAGFVGKNNDKLATDLQDCATKSKNKIFSAVEPKLKRRGSNVVARTVWTKYRDGLSSLMNELEETQSRYIRCIKPNASKQAGLMENSLTLHQLRSAGVVAAITISRSAFPNRLEHLQVWDRFRTLFPSDEEKASIKKQAGLIQNIRTVMSSALSSLEIQENGRTVKAFAIGKTRTYFRAGVLEHLESVRYQGMEEGVIKIQALTRGYLTRRKIVNKSNDRDVAAAKIQSFVRTKISKVQVKQTQSKKSEQVARLRRMKAARDKRKKNRAAATIQALIRGGLQRPKYRVAVLEYRKNQSIKDQIAHLKAKLARADEEKERAVKEAEERVTNALAAVADEGMDSAEVQHISLKAKLEESNKVLDFLKRERKRLMGLLKTHKERCDRVIEQQKATEGATANVHEKMAEVQKYMDILEGNKATLAKNKEIYVQQIKKYRKDIQTGTAYKQNEEEVKGVYQDAVERIVALVQEECNNDDLVEDIYLLAMECGEFGENKEEFGDLDDLEELEDGLSDTEISIGAY